MVFADEKLEPLKEGVSGVEELKAPLPFTEEPSFQALKDQAAEITKGVFFAAGTSLTWSGRRAFAGFDYSNPLSTYIWSGSQNQWLACSLIPGLSPRGKRAMKLMQMTEGPVDKSRIDAVLQNLLGGYTSRPQHFLDILKNHPRVSDDLDRLAVSSSLPIYHASGNSKHVFAFLMMLLELPEMGKQRVDELLLAMKIERSRGAISTKELKYHKGLCEVDDPAKPLVSRLLGWLDFKLRDEDTHHTRVSFETFVAGRTAHYYQRDNSQSLRLARIVTRGTLRLMRLACKAGYAINFMDEDKGVSDDCSLADVEVRFPADLNPSNFIIDRDLEAHFTDPGHYQPPHLFAHIALRLIHYYWQIPIANRGTCLLPLEEFMEEVERFSGKDEARKLMEQFACTVESLLGTPYRQIRSMYPIAASHQLGARLAGLHAPASFGRGYISNGARKARLMTKKEERGEEPDIDWYYTAGGLPGWFSLNRLKVLSRELRAVLLENHDRESQAKRFSGRLRRQTPIKPKDIRSMLDHAHALAVTRPVISPGMVNSVTVYFPFSSPWLLSVGCNIVAISSSTISRVAEEANRFMRKTAAVSKLLEPFLPDPTAQEILANVTDLSLLIPNTFRKVIRRSVLSEQQAETYLKTLIFMHAVFKERGFGVLLDPNILVKDRLKSAFAKLLGCDPKAVFGLLAESFPELFGGRSESDMLPHTSDELEKTSILLAKVLNSRKM